MAPTTIDDYEKLVEANLSDTASRRFLLVERAMRSRSRCSLP